MGGEQLTDFDGGFGIFIGSTTPSTVFTAHTEPAVTSRSAHDGTESGRCARRRTRGGDRHDPGGVYLSTPGINGSNELRGEEGL